MHIAKAGYIKPILDLLESGGSNIQNLIRQSGLDKYRLDDPEKYVPLIHIHDFLNNLKYVEGISDFLTVFSPVLQLQAISQWGNYLVHTTDMFTASKLAESGVKQMLTNQYLSFSIEGARSVISIGFEDNPRPGREIQEQINIALIINSIFMACGKEVAPLEIHVQQETISGLDRVIPSGWNTRIFTHQAETSFVFNSELLWKPLMPNAEIKNPKEYQVEVPSMLKTRYELLLDANDQEVLPSIKEITEIAGMSESTLRRRLANEGTTFFEVLDNWRLKKALALIGNQHLGLKEIATELRYSNLPNFERAFKRWTGLTPGQYRNQL